MAELDRRTVVGLGAMVAAWLATARGSLATEGGLPASASAAAIGEAARKEAMDHFISLLLRATEDDPLGQQLGIIFSQGSEQAVAMRLAEEGIADIIGDDATSNIAAAWVKLRVAPQNVPANEQDITPFAHLENIFRQFVGHDNPVPLC